MIEFNNEELNCKQENLHKSSDGFIEDQFDAYFITLQVMIEEIGQKESISKGIIYRYYFHVMMNSKIYLKYGIRIFTKILAQTATLLAVEQEDDEITFILQVYVRRKSNRNTSERLQTIIDERSTIDEVSDNPKKFKETIMILILE
ncbi:hypothetical protein RhiirA5_502802 [Rhizophagus irregularis]|uniref:Uncharacterized protein n=1 Tax=Rhizophagus irregularis TaxID=588596 RepID=A0A2N0PC50_9GLOM|nr:hypothetical protein RhiirA5_502802 [Rhizophagus irregularis]